MTRQQIINYFGNITQACDYLGYSRFAVWRWKKYGVPIRAQQLIEAKTNGALKAQKRLSRAAK